MAAALGSLATWASGFTLHERASPHLRLEAASPETADWRQEMDPVSVTIYTDPGCPFGFNAQRQEAQLLWHYGHALDVTRRMIVLREQSATYEEAGFSREMIAANSARLRKL